MPFAYSLGRAADLLIEESDCERTPQVIAPLFLRATARAADTACRHIPREILAAAGVAGEREGRAEPKNWNASRDRVLATERVQPRAEDCSA